MPSSMVFRLVREEKSKREKGTPSQNSRLDASSINTRNLQRATATRPHLHLGYAKDATRDGGRRKCTITKGNPECRDEEGTILEEQARSSRPITCTYDTNESPERSIRYYLVKFPR